MLHFTIPLANAASNQIDTAEFFSNENSRELHALSFLMPERKYRGVGSDVGFEQTNKRFLPCLSEKAMAPHSSTLAWKIHGQRSLVGCRLWGCTESDQTEVT